jgi:ORF6N domain
VNDLRTGSKSTFARTPRSPIPNAKRSFRCSATRDEFLGSRSRQESLAWRLRSQFATSKNHNPVNGLCASGRIWRPQICGHAEVRLSAHSHAIRNCALRGAAGIVVVMSTVPVETSVDIATRILNVRDQRVLLDSQLAALYGVTTKRLNEQVRRNIDRFPDDSLYALTAEELESVNPKLELPNNSPKGRGGRRIVKLRESLVPRSTLLCVRNELLPISPNGLASSVSECANAVAPKRGRQRRESCMDRHHRRHRVPQWAGQSPATPASSDRRHPGGE